MNENDQYFNSRLAFDQKRNILWSTLCKYFFSKYVPRDATVLDLGAGWCDFINNIECKKKIAIDQWEGIYECANDDVEVHNKSVVQMPYLETSSVDVVFASNLVEHLNREELKSMVQECGRILKSGGLIILLQPNFRDSYRHYFDDYTHVSIWTDIGIKTFMESFGWESVVHKGKFLPLTIKSRFPVSSFLIRMYLKSPFKPLSGQMLLIFQNK
jgi:SAM-dependent methyltransferase